MVALVLERVRVVLQGRDPRRVQEGVVGLPLESADVIAQSVELDGCLGLDPSQDRLSGDQIPKADARCVGGQRDTAFDQSVAEDKFPTTWQQFGFCLIRSWIDQPILGHSKRRAQPEGEKAHQATHHDGDLAI